MSDSNYFLDLQTQTGWGRVLSRFRDWTNPQPGWLTLDVGCGPGLMPALLAQRGCCSLGLDIDPQMFIPTPLHPQVSAADVMHPPFPELIFDLVTASNLLFLLPDPQVALQEMTRRVRPCGQVATLKSFRAFNRGRSYETHRSTGAYWSGAGDSAQLGSAGRS